MMDIKELERLAPTADEMLSGLHADEMMKRRILTAAREKTMPRRASATSMRVLGRLVVRYIFVGQELKAQAIPVSASTARRPSSPSESEYPFTKSAICASITLSSSSCACCFI